MKRVQALALDLPQAPSLAWSLLIAEVLAAVLLFSSGQVPTALGTAHRMTDPLSRDGTAPSPIALVVTQQT